MVDSFSNLHLTWFVGSGFSVKSTFKMVNGTEFFIPLASHEGRGIYVYSCKWTNILNSIGKSG